jgi:hypothetical protein
MKGRPPYPEGTEVEERGYTRVKVGRRWVPQHRLVMMAKLGRALEPGEVVRHRNGDKGDNRPENLLLDSHGERTVICPGCGVEVRFSESLKMSLGEVAEMVATEGWA